MYLLTNVTLEFFEKWTSCLAWSCLHLSLVFEKSLQLAKELVKMIRGTYICGDVFLSYLLKGSLVSLVSFRISAS